MGVLSTRYITRQDAIDRIIEIDYLVEHGDYRGIQNTSFEESGSRQDHKDLQNFVENSVRYRMSDITKWTNDMLGLVMDKPFYRWSFFDNYIVVDTEDEVAERRNR